ncbi:MAG: DUF202 domain-containing protein [Clostridia bacterium]|nr:DUF202 domain-containing protein [Clostridia bacterium]
MSNNNKISPEAKMVRIASVLIALAIIAICFGIARVEDTATKIIVFAAAAGLLFIGAIFVIVVVYAKYAQTHKRNYFLYDKKKKGDRPSSELNFEFIRGKVVDYMAMFKRGKKLYVGEIFMDTPWSIKAMKPLMCYELLYELSADGLDACRTFLGYGMECSRMFSEQLMQSGDASMAADIANFFSDYARDKGVAKEFLQYVSSKKEHIEKRVVEYTKNNIDKFVL